MAVLMVKTHLVLMYATLFCVAFPAHSIEAVQTTTICDNAAKKFCKKLHKESCSGGSSECGDCLEGYSKVASICVDVSRCKSSQTPIKMVLLLDSSGSLGAENFREQKKLAKDLVNVFPINKFAMRTFSTNIQPYPSSGGFVDKATALAMIPGMQYTAGTTYTGKAIEETVKLLKNERESFNIVIVFTDGKATDGQCIDGYTCDPNLHPHYGLNMCKKDSNGAYGAQCTLEIQAEKLKALPDRNQTVSVVAVGFGRVDLEELKFIASDDNNVIMAQGENAAAGLANLKKLLDQLVAKVCNNLPEDCVLEYTPWSACDAPCGPQSQRRKITRVITQARNGGKTCPSAKALRKNYYRPCPAKPTCPPTTTPATKTTTATTTTAQPFTTATPTNSVTSTGTDTGTVNNGITNTKAIDTGVTTGQPGAGDNRNANAGEVDGEVPSGVMWTLATACYGTMLLV